MQKITQSFQGIKEIKTKENDKGEVYIYEVIKFTGEVLFMKLVIGKNEKGNTFSVDHISNLENEIKIILQKQLR
jgi:hypothetical protein